MKNSWKIYLLMMIGFLAGTVEFVVAGILDIISKDFNVPFVLAGQLVTVFSLTFAIGTPIVIALTTRIKRKRLLMISLYLFLLGNIIAFYSWNIAVLLTSRIILALAIGIFNVVGLTMARNLAPKHQQGSAIATVIAGMSASLVLGVPIGRVIASRFDWHDIFAGIAGFTLFAILAVGIFIPRVKGQEAIPLLKQIAVLQNRQIRYSLLLTLLWIGGYATVFTYVSPYLSLHFHMPQKWIALSLFLFGISSFMGAKVSGLMTDRWGAPPTLTVSLSIHGLILLLLTLTRSTSMATIVLLMCGEAQYGLQLQRLHICKLVCPRMRPIPF